MTQSMNAGRRRVLRELAAGLSLAGIAARSAHGAELPLLSEQDPAAKAVAYVADASRANSATSGAMCSNCSVYGGAEGAAQGTCTLFPGKLVKAAGWCKSWSGL
jgi:hypothetical protein